MTDEKTTYYVKIEGNRPDFRMLAAFLWGDFHNINSDGNANNPASREWTELTLQNRESPFERVDINPIKTDPLVLKVKSNRRDIAARTAYILAKETNGMVADELESEYKHYRFLISETGDDFNLQDALSRFENSIFAKTTLENPYPS
jgi:hypothetical protein